MPTTMQSCPRLSAAYAYDEEDEDGVEGECCNNTVMQEMRYSSSVTERALYYTVA